MSGPQARPPGAGDRYLEDRRERMVRNLVEGRGVRDSAVLEDSSK